MVFSVLLSASSDYVVASSSMFNLMHLYWLEYAVLWNLPLLPSSCESAKHALYGSIG